MAVRFGYLVQARNFAQTNTTASAFLFGATGQSAIMCGPESNYLKGDQRLVVEQAYDRALPRTEISHNRTEDFGEEVVRGKI